ncbi:ArnT family glycosyltransferase [Legionella fallonii]|uniref:Putative dolichyl-phosphate mannosyltransferase n=1 Tax=Legionella fallonii LLAP-10 TaxID=1212491 RepID=A0A098GC23_9GAMM|nr:glycosyltransferase family 39 protein [Legionella fallonii]CEG59036.1 putative dolichyl-phosphate mannosyltransferase [Legionella fallonii LLAP-10]
MQSIGFTTIKSQVCKIVPTSLLNVCQDRKLTQYFYLILGFSLFLHLISIATTVLIVEEAYYWNYAQHLDFSYLDHPPMVAILIKLSTLIFGTTEFGVRAITIFCFIITATYSYKLTQLINKNSAPYALILLAILPFFFLHSQIITPDVPLIACWSASIYCLYRALVRNEANLYYLAGIWLGLGMLSKYTIALVGLAALVYILLIPSARYWLRRKEPYFCAGIALLIFTPVIYWNATHQWVSFIFQSSRRLVSTSSIRLHHVILLTLFFLMPIGIYGFCQLMKKNSPEISSISTNTKHFMRIFTLVPLTIFALFSLNHAVKFNWVGPIFLALIPWLAALIANNPATRLSWLKSCVFLLGCYAIILMFLFFNTSQTIHKKYLKDILAWDKLTQQFNILAAKIEEEMQQSPTFVPLDSYHIGSELSFYQAKLLSQGGITKSYPVAGSHVFGNNSLMYRYWSNKIDYLDKPLILISTEPASFDNPILKEQTIEQSVMKRIVSVSQGQGIKGIPYYYKVVRIRKKNAISHPDDFIYNQGQ